MAEKHGSYYVPESSIWPIVGAGGLLLLALGSLNFSSLWGTMSTVVGAAILLIMLFGWFSNVIHESKKGFYDEQMNRTFWWGMFWFLFCEICFLGTLLGALLYTRVSILPWLAGEGAGGSLLTHYVLWPNFQVTWPLVKGPNPFAFSTLKQLPTGWGIPLVNTIILLISAVSANFALRALRKKQRFASLVGLIITMLLGLLFLISQIDFTILLVQKYGVTISSGIYGSLLFMLYGFHDLHALVALIMLLSVFFLSTKKYFSPTKIFGFAAAVWFWNFITIAWLAIFICVYWT